MDAPPPTAARTVIRNLRGPREKVDAWRAQAVFDEEETAAAGVGVAARVMILTGSECRFTCSMCDLWRHTLPGPTPLGSLPAQIQHGLARPPAAADMPRWIKLYNGSNFFDDRNVPRQDVPQIARLVAAFERVVVENHPRLCGAEPARFRAELGGRLEVAMGLESIHPQAITRLNKQMSLDDFAAACQRLRSDDIDTRAFVLLGVPGVSPEDAVAWCLKSVAFALDCGVRHVSIVPLRGGNGWIDHQLSAGTVALPTAHDVEATATQALALPRPATCVITIDLWDFARLTGTCTTCLAARQQRLAAMNLTQKALPATPLSCGCL